MSADTTDRPDDCGVSDGAAAEAEAKREILRLRAISIVWPTLRVKCEAAARGFLMARRLRVWDFCRVECICAAVACFLVLIDDVAGVSVARRATGNPVRLS